MLEAIEVHRSSPELSELERLYARAFPVNERSPLSLLLDDPTGCGTILAFREEGQLRGFASMVTVQDITHILYFAIEDEERGHGYGSEALALIRLCWPASRILADIELERPDAPNPEQRRKRKAFYLRNGFTPSPVRYRWRHEEYEILVQGGTLTRAEYDAFWAEADARNHSFRGL